MEGKPCGSCNGGRSGSLDIVTTVMIEGSPLDVLAKGLYQLVLSSTQEERTLAPGLGQVNKFSRLTNRFNNGDRDRNNNTTQTTSSGNQV